MALLALGLPVPEARAVETCGNPVACENQLPGTPQSVWDDGTDDPTILGFATQMSVNVGGTIQFKVKTDARLYTIDIYRLGYYQGNGARKVATIPLAVSLPQSQPACLRDTSTDLYDCGNWAVSASWTVPTTAVAGVYIADLLRADTGGRSHIVFVVRNDASHSDVVFQTSDTTWQAYNTYGGASLYQGVNLARGYKVSYNRPFVTRNGVTMRDYLYANEYPTIRFLEANGVDVSYISGVDVAMGQGHLTNHKAFLSVGHDEYWSSGQRDAVTQARDAGVNLMFLSGNEVYWRTRWETSIDGSGTPFRTLVCYKDTKESSQIDPVSATSTWRDPRYAGFAPENLLTGTMYVGQGADLPLQVTAEQGKLRMWRNTRLATLAAGTTTSVSTDLVGYEFDGSPDNGYAPAGQIFTSTTVATVPEILQDFGNQTAPGTLNHHFSLYRASSGALVFGAGTIQYGWGLDANHDLSTHAALPEIQQATLNLLADMGVSATTVQAGLVAATASSDHTAPVVTITAPTTTSIAFGTQVAVSGTATDAAGKVGGVEVSLDGGASWHPAGGSSTWTYSGPLRASGPTAIQVRATDDSLNTSAPVSPTAVTVTGPSSLFGDWTPATPDSGDGSATTLGMAFVPTADGFVNGVRFYKSAANTGSHTGTLYSATGTVLATGTFTNETASGWQTLTFSAPVAVAAGTRYVVAYYAPVGHYAYEPYFFAPGPFTTGAITAPGGLGVANGVYGSGATFPSQTYHQANYWVDVTFTLAADAPLAASAVSPVPSAGSVLETTTVVGRFNKDPGDTTMAIGLSAGSVQVAGASTYDPVTRQLTFTPAQPLAYATTFTATITDAVLGTPFSWTFTTVGPPRAPGVCPCSLFQDADQPTTVATGDVANLTLGVAFSTTANGTLTAIRYWKPLGLVGSHPVTLYGPTGTVLGTATAAGETTVGWQSAVFATPIPVTAGTLYTAAVQYPTGGYPYSYGLYTSPRTIGPLTTPASAGRYLYGTGLPTNTSTTSYYVDPMFSSAPSAPPVVVSASPGDGARSVSVNTAVTVTFNGPIATGSGTVTLTGPTGSVAGTVTGTSTTRTFTPSSPLAEASPYSLSVTGAVTPDGVAQTQAYAETFTTSGVSACPCSLLETTLVPTLPNLSDTSGLTLGLKFSPTVDGFVSGLRYWRASANNGTHTGKLYSATGTVLATVTFVDGPEGWQQAMFSSPVAVTAGTRYFATYYSPNGTYSATTGAFTTQLVNPPLVSVDSGGVFASGDGFPNQSFGAPNYFVDVVFVTSATDSAPSVASVAPAGGATGVAVGSPVTVTFASAVGSAAVSLAGPGGSVPGSLVTTASSATFTPSAALAAGTSYTVTVTASSPGGTAMAPFTSTFTTETPVSVVSTSPAANATGVALAATVGVAFGGSPATGSVAVTLTPAGGSAVAGTLVTTATSATFTPSAALAESTVYTARVTATSLAGTVMAPVSWSFSTVSPAPVVATRTPVVGATGVAANTGVSATFTKAVDPGGSTLTLSSAAGAVAGTVTRTSTGVSFAPAEVLAGNTVYTATVGASSPLGTSMTPVSWSFTTETAARVSAIVPANAATGVSIGTTVRATFSKAVTPASIQVTVTDPSGAVVAGTLATTATTGTFTPSALLAPGTLYRVTARAALASGLVSTPFASTFTTVAVANIFPASLTPTTSTTSGNPVTVGVRFRSSVATYVTGIRFYLPANVTSTYTVSLWSSTGTRLATASGTPTSTTAGWRTVQLTTPVRLTANTTYVASMRALSAQYTTRPLSFPIAYTNGTFTVPSLGGATATTDVFPATQSSTNYFVDVVTAR